MYRLSLAVFCVVLAIAQAKIDKEQAKANYEKCKEETGATETYDEIFKEKKIPTSDKGMCLVECLLKKREIYDSEGKYNPEGAKKYFSKVFEEKPENIEKSLAIAEECSKIDVEGLDKCEAAVKHLTCAKTKASQQNIKYETD
ncbi:general odorant-binding protein 19d-like [Macrosteles quadrilineatus]|uniref:general odorant-binding protein 19d-like n=1 Tax=Macrosteles quadrilineatus TaxID=74068 RepID=UPI0023E32596|nr:general odorant-binding protein 19d-like [Macrosteles quadrilineatus]